MITEKENKRISKFLSFVLRHHPELIGIELDGNGWTDVSLLIQKSGKTEPALDFEMLKYIVDTNAKKRFSFNDQLDKIRANQGHSVEVDLGYTPKPPPDVLYHVTGPLFLDIKKRSGMYKKSSHHFNLSHNKETAINVGQRHGKPFVFEVLSGQMYRDNYEFFLSDNEVWLTDHVPAKYLRS
jgi:putative RNA 2'-phosphotransferase